MENWDKMFAKIFKYSGVQCSSVVGCIFKALGLNTSAGGKEVMLMRFSTHSFYKYCPKMMHWAYLPVCSEWEWLHTVEYTRGWHHPYYMCSWHSMLKWKIRARRFGSSYNLLTDGVCSMTQRNDATWHWGLWLEQLGREAVFSELGRRIWSETQLWTQAHTAYREMIDK